MPGSRGRWVLLARGTGLGGIEQSDWPHQAERQSGLLRAFIISKVPVMETSVPDTGLSP